MQVHSYNLPKLIKAAQLEIQSLREDTGISKATKGRLINFLQSYILLHDPRKDSTRYYGNNFFLQLENYPDDLINAFNLMAHKLKLGPGEILNILLKEIVLNDNVEAGQLEINAQVLKKYVNLSPKLEIAHYNSLVIEYQDLKEIENQIKFYGIKTLKFDNKVSEQIFRDKIHSIVHCQKVFLPKSYSKLMILSKIRFCKEIFFTE